MLNEQNRIRPGECHEKILWYFEIQTDHLIPARRPDLVIIVDFNVLEDHKVKIKENEKRDKYLDLAWELKKRCGTRE